MARLSDKEHVRTVHGAVEDAVDILCEYRQCVGGDGAVPYLDKAIEYLREITDEGTPTGDWLRAQGCDHEAQPCTPAGRARERA